MSLGYKFFRDSWIKLAILTVGLGAFLWAVANGEAKAEPGVVPLVVGIAIVGHVVLLTMMVRTKRKEEAERIAATAPAKPVASPSLTVLPEQGGAEKGFMQQELSPRGIGILLVVCGLGLGYMSAIMPIQDAAAHKASVSTSLKGALVVPFLLLNGALYAIWPAQMTRFSGPIQHPNTKGWLISIPFLLLGFGLYLYVQSTIESYGYTFR